MQQLINALKEEAICTLLCENKYSHINVCRNNYSHIACVRVVVVVEVKVLEAEVFGLVPVADVPCGLLDLVYLYYMMDVLCDCCLTLYPGQAPSCTMSTFSFSVSLELFVLFLSSTLLVVVLQRLLELLLPEQSGDLVKWLSAPHTLHFLPLLGIFLLHVHMCTSCTCLLCCPRGWTCHCTSNSSDLHYILQP